jgi:tRNA pseudouridine38-40 synthase
MNIKIVFSYDGSCFNGSQKQPSKNTVQDIIEDVLKSVGIENDLILSGRTDKNVHATNQVANIHLPDFWKDLKKLKKYLDKHLPNSIQIKHIKEVNENFHARFSAKKRVYRYIVSNKQTNPFNNNYITYCKNINSAKIDEAIKLFKGTFDFAYFSKKGSSPKSTVREIYSVKFYQYKDFYIFKFTANSFLRSQIRMMVEFLFKISDGTYSLQDLEEQLNKKRLVSQTLAPPNGLYLSKITY